MEEPAAGCPCNDRGAGRRIEVGPSPNQAERERAMVWSRKRERSCLWPQEGWRMRGKEEEKAHDNRRVHNGERAAAEPGKKESMRMTQRKCCSLLCSS